MEKANANLTWIIHLYLVWGGEGMMDDGMGEGDGLTSIFCQAVPAAPPVKMVSSKQTKFRRIRVPTRDSFSRWILKVCKLGRGEAQYWKPKIVFSGSTNTSPVQTCLNIIVLTRILIHVKTTTIISICACIYKSAKDEAQIVKANF